MFASELVTTWEEMDTLRNDWDRLWKISDSISGEFYKYEWMRFIASQWLGPDEHPWCVVLRKKGSVVGLAPLFLTKADEARHRMSCRASVFLSSPITVRHAMLTSPVFVKPLCGEICRHLRQSRNIDLVNLTGLGPDVAPRIVDGFVEAGARCTVLQTNQGTSGMPGTAAGDACSILLQGAWEAYMKSRKGKFRQNLKRRSSLAEAHMEMSFWHCSGGRQILGRRMRTKDLAVWIDRIEEESWQKDRSFHFGRFGRDRIEQLLDIVAREKALCLTFLLNDGAPIAYQFGLVQGDYLRICLIAFDSRYSHYSPGLLLFCELIKLCFQDGKIREIELGGSNHRLKRELANKRDSSFTICVYGSSIPARLLHYYRRLWGKWHAFPGRRRARGRQTALSSFRGPWKGPIGSDSPTPGVD